MLKYYYDLGSPPSRALYIFLKKTGIPFVHVPVALRKREHMMPEFAKINPFCQVPVIDDNGFVLNESVAIFAYLADKYNVPQHWYPANPQLRARVNAFVNWHQCTMWLGVRGVFRTLVMQPLSVGEAPEETMALSRVALSRSLTQMEQIFLQDTPFVYMHQPSIADLLAACSIMQLLPMGEVTVSSSVHPRLVRWLDRVKGAIGRPLFDESHRFITAFGQHYKEVIGGVSSP